MQVCTSLQTDNHANTSPLVFYRPDALPVAQPTASKHWRHKAPPISAGLMPTEARGNYLPEPPYLRETKTYHSQPLESIRHAGNYFVPLSIWPIFSFYCRSCVKLLNCWRAEKKFLYFRRPPWGLRPVAFATSATWLIRHCPPFSTFY